MRLEPRESSSEANPTLARRTGRLRWFLYGASSVLLVTLIGSGLYARHAYQPLGIGVTWAFEGESLVREPDVQVKEVAYRHGDAYDYYFALLNRGRVGVTILDIQSAVQVLDESPRIGTRLMGTPQPARWEEAEPWRPFSLPGGDLREIFVRGRLAHCQFMDGGDTRVLRSLAVKFRILGETRRALIRSPTTVIVRDEGERLDPGRRPFGPRRGCPVLAGDGHADIEVDLEPRPRLGVTNRSAGTSLSDCEVRVQGASGRVYEGRFDGELPPSRTTYLSASRLRDGPSPWVVEDDPPSRTEVSCLRDGRPYPTYDVHFDAERIGSFIDGRGGA